MLSSASPPESQSAAPATAAKALLQRTPLSQQPCHSPAVIQAKGATPEDAALMEKLVAQVALNPVTYILTLCPLVSGR